MKPSHSQARFLLVFLLIISTRVVSAETEPASLAEFPVAEMQRDVPIPHRKLEEVKKIVTDFTAPDKAEPIHIILAAGPKTHGVNSHDYPFFQKRMKTLLGFGHNVTVDSSWIFPSAEQYAKADVVVFNSMMQDLDPEHAARLNDFLTAGGGAVYVHIGVQAQAFFDEQCPNVGLVWHGKCRFRHGPVDLDFTGAEHPITKGFTKLHFYDESYWQLKGNRDKLTILATSLEADKKDQKKSPRPQMWTTPVGKGRSVALIPGHYSWTYDDPMFRILFLRSIAWAHNDDLNRFNNLILPGARVK